MADFEASDSLKQLYAFDKFMQVFNVTNSFTLIGSKVAGFLAKLHAR